MLVRYDHTDDGIVSAEIALIRLCDLLHSPLKSMHEMDGDILMSDYQTLLSAEWRIDLIKRSLYKGGEEE
jgi:hypothetical protein|tara:strand:+ start:1943 stop:2152 length:210 start_codon:yes stop_codon:yes gene_type:complete